MSTAKFQAALKKTLETKSVDNLLFGNNANYIGEGDHSVVIQSVDLADIEKGRIKVVYLNDDGKAHNETLFLTNRNGEEIGYGVRQLWSAFIPDKDAIGTFVDELVSGNYEVFGTLHGLRAKIKLGRGKGFITKVDGLGKFSAFDAESGDRLLDEDYDTVKEAQESAEAKGYKKSYIRVQKIEATHADSNISAFNLAIEAMRKVKAAGSGASRSVASGAGGRTAII